MSIMDTMPRKDRRAHSAPVPSSPTLLLYGLLGRIGRAVERWRQRRNLLELTDRELRDIGLTRRQARREAARPFWD
jgi:uncharacterized protein YjiS (DUF1127 family)